MGTTNLRRLFAKKKQAEERLEKILPFINNDSGIYILTRDDESGLKFCYIGQALHIKDRLVSHILGYQQRIDISIKKRGFYDKVKRPYGWVIKILFVDKDKLDVEEQGYIKCYAELGYQLYNRTSGSQGKGKVGINDGQSTKGYRDGVAYGRKQMLKEIKEYFDKYLNYTTKSDRDCYKKAKKGELPQLKEIYVKKFNEFKALLEDEK